MVDYGIERLLDRRGRSLLARCRRLAPSFRIGIEEMRVGPCYVWRMRIGGRNHAEAVRVGSCGRPPRTLAEDLAELLDRAVETILEND
jgi:hypothetical protein